jgi:hypothetical protein
VELVNSLCARAADPLYQWSERKCKNVDGAGVGSNFQEVRCQGRAGAAKPVAGQWVLVEARKRTNDKGELWLERTVAAGEWSGACARKTDQLNGERLLNARARRGAKADYRAELTAKKNCASRPRQGLWPRGTAVATCQ